VKIKLGNRMAAPVLDQFARWLPARADQFRRMADKAAKHGIAIDIEPVSPRRSTDANARYWVIITALAQYVGMSKGEMHTECLSEYHGFDLVEFRGSIHKRPRGRSHNLSRDDFGALMEIAERWAAEMGVMWEDAA
jgi:hypothetical protein